MDQKLNTVTKSVNSLYSDVDTVKEKMVALKTGQAEIRKDIKTLMLEMKRSDLPAQSLGSTINHSKL